jgi:hypothetical protein
MNCSKYKKLLVEFADGNLDYQQSVDVQAHLAQCESCKIELDRLKASLEIIRSDNVLMKEHTPPADFPERIMGRVKEYEKSYNLFSNTFALSVAITISIFCLGLGLFLNIRPSEKSDIDQNMFIESAKIELPKKIILAERNIKNNVTQKELSENKVIKKKSKNKKYISENSDQIKINVKLELVEVLGQTIELIEGDEKEWEIEI